jgi:hypothetical protein
LNIDFLSASYEICFKKFIQDSREPTGKEAIFNQMGKVAGGKWCLEEATPNHLRAGRPYGPRRCGGPEHSAGYLVEI